MNAIEKVTRAHKKQILTYLKPSGMKFGYLLNFNEALLKDGLTRCVNNHDEELSAPLRLRAIDDAIMKGVTKGQDFLNDPHKTGMDLLLNVSYSDLLTAF